MLSQTAEYALRAVAALASCGENLVPTTELAKLADVPPPYLAKVLQQLAAAEVIRGRRGVGGGYTLARSADQIALFDVVTAVGALRSPRTDSDLDALGDGLTSLHRMIDQAAAAFLRSLQETSVADIAQNRDAIREIEPAAPAAAPAASPRPGRAESPAPVVASIGMNGSLTRN